MVPEGGDQKSSSMAPPLIAQLIGQVIQLLDSDLTSAGFELLDVRIFQGGGRFQVRIYVDLAEGGITLDRCTQAARTAGMLLEEADLFPGQYVIEVSSPGIRRPLRKLSHFESATGQKIDLKLKRGSGRSRVRGTLLAVEGQALVVQPVGSSGQKTDQEPAGEEEVETLRLELDSIAEANLDPEFDAKALINADRRKRKDDRRLKRQEKAKKGRKSRPKAGKIKPGEAKKADPDSEV